MAISVASSAPEQFAAHRERRHAEHAARDRLVGFAAQCVLDGAVGDPRFRIGNAEPIGEIDPLDRKVRQPAVAPDETEDLRDRVEPGIARDREPQQRQRIERVRVRKPERDAERLRLPHDEPVGEHALGRNLRRSLLAVRVEDGREQHGMGPYRRRMRLQAFALQVRERRDEIEIPVGDHRRSSVDGNRRQTARR